jgi:DNA invertase Pin-like site-specific DNA recombinase
MNKKSKIKSSLVGYIHAKSRDVSVNLQEEALKASGCKTIFLDISDDIDVERPKLVKAVKYAKKKKHGCIVVYSIEHLAENLENLSDICKVLVNLKLRLISILEDILIIPYPNVKNFISSSTMKIGYVHTYQGDSSHKLQQSVLKSEGCSKIYSGNSSGADFERPELVKLVKHADKNKSNCLIINSFQRLASSLENLCDICKVLKTLSIPLRSLDENVFIKRNSLDKDNLNYLNNSTPYESKISEEEIRIKNSFIKRIRKRNLIKTVIIVIILSGVYYWLLTRFDADEMSEAQYEAMHKKSTRNVINNNYKGDNKN